jgi:hypothetical protein
MSVLRKIFLFQGVFMVDEKISTDVALPGAASPPPKPEKPQRDPAQPTVSGDLNQLREELENLKQSFVEYTQRDLPEIDRVKQQLQNTALQRDSAANELKELKRKNILRELAGKHGFNDVDYLDFILQKNHIDPDEPELLNGFLEEFRKSNPRFFSLPVKPGSGSRPGGSRSVAMRSNHGRLDAVQMMLDSAPELY